VELTVVIEKGAGEMPGAPLRHNSEMLVEIGSVERRSYPRDQRVVSFLDSLICGHTVAEGAALLDTSFVLSGLRG